MACGRLVACMADYWWAALLTGGMHGITELHCLLVGCIAYWWAALPTGGLHGITEILYGLLAC